HNTLRRIQRIRTSPPQVLGGSRGSPLVLETGQLLIWRDCSRGRSRSRKMNWPRRGRPSNRRQPAALVGRARGHSMLSALKPQAGQRFTKVATSASPQSEKLTGGRYLTGQQPAIQRRRRRAHHFSHGLLSTCNLASRRMT
ncbi:hypothetical protein CC86DRAFT_438485, partial [Ophiobolus disseminans]